MRGFSTNSSFDAWKYSVNELHETKYWTNYYIDNKVCHNVSVTKWSYNHCIMTFDYSITLKICDTKKTVEKEWVNDCNIQVLLLIYIMI